MPDCERPTISVVLVIVSSMLSALSNSPPSGTSVLQPFAPVFTSSTWSWLHLARSLAPSM